MTRLGEPYAEAFTPPGGHASESAFYYAFTYGNVRFISLDSEDTEAHARAYGYIGDPTSRQYQWLLRELSAARQDPRLDWTVVYWHHPPYSASTGFGGHGSQLPMRRALSPLMDGYSVRLVYNGHDHDFQRSRPLRGNAVVEANAGTVYYVTGGGGGRTAFRGTGADWFTANSEQTFHYLRAKVDRYTMTIEAVNIAGQVFDTYEVTIPEDQRKPPRLPAEPVPFDDEADPAATPDVEAAGAR